MGICGSLYMAGVGQNAYFIGPQSSERPCKRKHVTGLVMLLQSVEYSVVVVEINGGSRIRVVVTYRCIEGVVKEYMLRATVLSLLLQFSFSLRIIVARFSLHFCYCCE